MIKIFFTCHGSTPGSRELVALAGQNAAAGKVGYYGFITSEERKKEPIFQAFFRDLVLGFTFLGGLLRFFKQAFSPKYGFTVRKA